MTRFVLDASALIAELFDEPGADTVHQALESGATMSAVNVAEVAASSMRTVGHKRMFRSCSKASKSSHSTNALRS